MQALISETLNLFINISNVPLENIISEIYKAGDK